MSTDEILDAIDRAVRDWEFSDDAMRWTPEPPKPQSPDTGSRVVDLPAGHLYVRDETHEWTAIGTVNHDYVLSPPWAVDEDESPVGMWGHSQPVTVTFTADMTRFVEAFARLAEQTERSMRTLAAAVKQAWEPTRRNVHLLHAQVHPKDHIRCRECNPCANPPPLKVNGAEYHRRRTSRSRRR